MKWKGRSIDVEMLQATSPRKEAARGGEEMNHGTLWYSIGVCRKPTDPPNPIHWVGSFFKAWWVGLGWVTKFFFIAGRVGLGS